jgi:hypothetical protein
MNDRELIANLDACRSGSDDLNQPELRCAAEIVANEARANEIRVRLLHIDAALIRTMHSVDVPAGMEGRLVARLQEAAGQAATSDAVTAHVPGPAVRPFDVAPVSPSRRDRAISRRQWIAWSAGLAAAAASLATLIVLQLPKELASDDLLAADRWHEALAKSGEWQPLEPDHLESHLLPDELRHWPSRYRDASNTVGRRAMAYDLSLRDGPRATLFVIHQATWVQAPASAPQRPQSSTLGYSIAYWQRGDTIYVVAIESDRTDEYQQLVRTVVPQAA